jgi:hypothetical protein
MPIIRRMVQNRQRLWCTALAVLQKTRGEEVVGVHLLGMVFTIHLHLVGYLFPFIRKILIYQISRIYVQWEPSCFMRRDGRKDRHDEAVGGYTLVTLSRIVNPHRNIVDGTRDRVTYQQLVTR